MTLFAEKTVQGLTERKETLANRWWIIASLPQHEQSRVRPGYKRRAEYDKDEMAAHRAKRRARRAVVDEIKSEKSGKGKASGKGKTSGKGKESGKGKTANPPAHPPPEHLLVKGSRVGEAKGSVKGKGSGKGKGGRKSGKGKETNPYYPPSPLEVAIEGCLTMFQATIDAAGALNEACGEHGKDAAVVAAAAAMDRARPASSHPWVDAQCHDETEDLVDTWCQPPPSGVQRLCEALNKEATDRKKTMAELEVQFKQWDEAMAELDIEPAVTDDYAQALDSDTEPAVNDGPLASSSSSLEWNAAAARDWASAAADRNEARERNEARKKAAEDEDAATDEANSENSSDGSDHAMIVGNTLGQASGLRSTNAYQWASSSNQWEFMDSTGEKPRTVIRDGSAGSLARDPRRQGSRSGGIVPESVRGQMGTIRMRKF